MTRTVRAVVSYRNSTSNHNVQDNCLSPYLVVSYRNSTSNHNMTSSSTSQLTVVSYRNSTSNHNSLQVRWTTTALYLIEILHQTTTIVPDEELVAGCILSKFYIKPQLESVTVYEVIVVSYRNSTSNHNVASSYTCRITVVSYRNSTSNHN